MHILVAEDNIINQRIAVRVLQQMGHTGVLVPDGAQALKASAAHRFDCCLLDVSMPGMDGLQALGELRQREAAGGARLPVIMVTAHDGPGERRRLMSLGADGYIAKPLSVPALQNELARLALA
jgi:CheY-like chemotaxis protein